MKLKTWLVVLLLTGCVGCDQASKQAAIHWLSDAPTFSFLEDTVRLTYIENHGAFLGMGNSWPEPVRLVLFTLMSAVMVVGALIYGVRLYAGARSWREAVPALGTALIAVGGLGNVIDRVVRDGAVVDFMNIGIGPLRTGIFNVADVQIMAGLALLVLWKPKPLPRKRPPEGIVG